MPDDTRKKWYDVTLNWGAWGSQKVDQAARFVECIKTAHELQKFITGLSKGWVD